MPERNEVPNLLDDISTRSKIRGVTLSQVVPQPVKAGPAPFDTYVYQMSVIGRYDQIGQFLADVASLQRIIVPYNLSVAAANSTAAKALGDSTGALLGLVSRSGPMEVSAREETPVARTSLGCPPAARLCRVLPR